jgi:hypothetical protein
MISSAIPARLQFQCGHAALVTLPRVKGESTAQRNQRIAREKSDALLRQCDFCGPTVAVTAAMLPEEVNGSHMTAADVLAAQPVAAAPVVAAEPIVVAEPALAEPVVVPEPALAEPVVVPELEPAPVVVVQPVSKAARKVRRLKPVMHAKTTRRAVERGYQFLVEYQVERVLRAANIRDALRQTAALGASEILAITRE